LAKLQPEYFRTDLLMSTYWRTLSATIGLLAFVLTILAAPSAHAVLDFKEVMAISSAIEGIYIEGQDGFYLPPGTDGQLLAETYPSDLQKRVRWDIVGQDDDLVIALDADTGLLSVDETSGLGWVTVQAAADGCAPRTKRIEIGCGCAGESGTCDTTAGAGAVVNGSVDVRMSLGQGDQGRPAGSLILSAKEPLAILSTPEALEIDSAGNDVKPLYRDNQLEQIITSQVIVNLVRFSEVKYEIHFYDIAFRGQTTDEGFYSLDPAAVPLVVWRIENPDASGETVDTLAVTEIRGGEEREFYYSYEADDHCWLLVSGNGLKIESKAEFFNDAGDRVVRTEIVGADGIPVKVEEILWHAFPFGEKRIRETIDPDGAALVTAYRYQTEPGPGYGKLIARIDPDGGWVRYSYDDEGRIVREVRPYLDAPYDASDKDVKLEATCYTPVDGADKGDRRYRRRPRLVIETTGGIETARTYYAYIRKPDGTRIEIRERATVQGCPYGHATNLRMETSYYPSSGQDPAAGKIRRRRSEDGRLTTYTYETGRFELARDPAECRFIPGKGRARRTTVIHGTEEHPEGIAHQTLRETIVTDAMGREKLRATHVRTEDGFTRIHWQFHTHDRLGRVIETLHANGIRTESSWGCCGKASETDMAGIPTRFVYDDLKRLVSRINLATGVVTAFTYDAAGRQTSSTQSNEGLRLVQTNRYDRAGRLIAQTDPAGLVTRYTEEKNISKTTLPGGATEISARHRDGRICSVTGTAVVARFYRYGVNPDGSQWTTVHIGGADSPRWEKTVRDLAGRVVSVAKPGFEGVEVTRNVYDDKGRLVRVESPGRAATLYVYDQLGHRIMAGLDVDGNGKLIPASRDRITASQSSYRQIESAWWRQEKQSIFARENSAEETTVSIRQQRLTGWKPGIVSEQVVADVHGNATRTIVSLDRFKHTRIRKVFTPDASIPSQAVFVDGRLAAVTTKTGITRTFGYDALGRRIAVEDPRKGISRLEYDSAGRPAYVEDPAGNRTRFEYDPETGRRSAVYNALHKATRYAYNARGQMVRTWGDVPYPVDYRYNEFGQMVEMHTFRGGTGWEGASWPEETGPADPTFWHYQAETGLLVAREDAHEKKTRYTYGPGGTLATRTWARLKNGNPLSTAYVHDPATGDLLKIDYSDETADIVFAHDRLGRKVRVSDAAGTHHFAYNETLQLASERLVGQQSYKIDRHYDDLGRLSGFRLDDGYEVSYGFDDKGRFAAVDWRTGEQTGGVAYRYLAQSDRLVGMESQNGLSVRYDYEPHRDVKTAVTNRFKDRLISQYEYQYDPLGRRINVRNKGEAFEDPGFWLYGYNDRNEVTSASRFVGADLKDQTQVLSDLERVYQYDPIGNRIKTIEGGSEAHYRTNALNQYEAISGPRQEEEYLLYDADGNLIEDGRFRYEWNGENRLVVVRPKNPESGDKRLTFAYDYIGRRGEKKVYSFDGTRYVPSETIHFIYDGWNMVKETKSKEDNTIDRFYVWGLDLSQTLQGAGGVGGLLATSDGSLTHAYVFDANGNVGQQIDDGRGIIKEHYEYEDYGRVLKSTFDDTESCQFSSKALDKETNFLYFGYRYFSPEIGRWLKKDPIAEIGGLNLYSFSNNNGINFNDILGLLLYAFDGTGNDSARDYKEGEYTNVYILFLSYSGGSSIAPGPGSSFGTVIYGGATGAGTGNRLKDAYMHFENNYKPETDSNGKIKATIDIIGFSRGAAIAREFANILANPEHIRFKGYKGCPVPIRFVGLFDTVDKTAFIDLNLKLPDLVEHAAHAVAADENRGVFPLSPIDDTKPHFDQKYFTGDHSDIGRGHGNDTNFLSLAPLFYIYHKGISAGVPFGDLSEDLYENFNSSITPHDLGEDAWYWWLTGKNDRGYTGAINGTY